VKRLGHVAALLFLASAAAQAEELEEILQLLMDKAIRVEITARVTEDDRETVWNMELSRLTVSGKAVSVRLDGSNIVVLAEFTPYREEDGSYLLVAQGETLVTTPEGRTVRYRPTVKSMPVNVGESVLFFPLGTGRVDLEVDPEETSSLNIELEVRIVPYAQDE
jgi:hypothetical protein